MTPRGRTTTDESGSITPLIIGFTLLVLMLVAVVVDVSAAFVRHQNLANLADGAALAGADAGAEVSVYATGRRQIPQTAEAARVGVAEYLEASGAHRSYPGLTFRTSVTDGGSTLRVWISAPVDLPMHLPGVPVRTTVSAGGAAQLLVRE